MQIAGQPWKNGFQGTVVGEAKIAIDKREQTATFTVPSPPSDEVLMRRDG